MKIIYVAATLPYSDGAEDFFIPEVKELVRTGHQVLIVPRMPEGDVAEGDARNLLGITVAKPLFSYEIAREALNQLTLSPNRALRALRLLFAGWNLITLLKNIAVFPKGLWLGRLAVKWQANHIHAHWASTTATMAMIAAETGNIAWSFTAHRGDIVQNNLLDTKFQHADFIRFISTSGVQLFRERGVRNIQKKARIIHMGVSLPPTTPGSTWETSKPVILCPANLIPVKGHAYLLQAMVLLKKRGVGCFLYLAGEGYLLDKLSEFVSSSALSDHVKFLGQVPQDTIFALYREKKVSMVVIPSIDLGHGLHEGIPVSLIEAMGFGIPIISTATGGIPELVNSTAGMLVQPKDPVALADAIETLIKDPVLKTRLGKAGRVRIEQEFSVEKTTAQLVYQMFHGA